VTGYYVRTCIDGQWQAVEVDHLTDEQLDEWIARREPGELVRWVRALVRFLRDHVRDHPGIELGPTDRFPDGKLGPHDRGEIAAGVTACRGRVEIHFGGPVSWIAMPPLAARELAALLLKWAAVAEQTGRPGGESPIPNGADPTTGGDDGS
jgi:hypothetical protein